MRLSLLLCSTTVFLLAGCASNERACELFAPPSAAATSPTAQNNERVEVLSGNASATHPVSGCAQ